MLSPCLRRPSKTTLTGINWVFDFENSRSNVAVFKQKIPHQSRFISSAREAHVFECLETHFLECVLLGSAAIDGFEAPYSCNRAINQSRQLVAELRCAVFEQPSLRFFRREPCGVAIRFLGRFEIGNLAQVSSDGLASRGHVVSLGRVFSGLAAGLAAGFAVGIAVVVAREGHLFDSPMNASLFKRFEGRGLGLREARFDSSFGEDPAPASSLNQQELQTLAAEAIANGRNLLAPRRLPRSRRRRFLC